VYDQEFEMVRHIKYFGFILVNDDNTTTDILQRFVTNDQTCYGLREQLSLLKLGKGLCSVSMLTYCVYSECLEQKYQEIAIGKLMKMVYGSQGFTMNFMNYIPHQKQSK